MYSQMSAELPKVEANKERLPPGAAEAMKYVLKKLRERIDSLKADKK